MRKFITIVLVLTGLCFAGEPLNPQFMFQYPRQWGCIPEQITWTQDDSRIAFVWNERNEGIGDVYTVKLPAGRPVRRTDFEKDIEQDDCPIRFLQWSSDNKTLYFYKSQLLYSFTIGEPTPQIIDTLVAKPDNILLDCEKTEIYQVYAPLVVVLDLETGLKSIRYQGYDGSVIDSECLLPMSGNRLLLPIGNEQSSKVLVNKLVLLGETGVQSSFGLGNTDDELCIRSVQEFSENELLMDIENSAADSRCILLFDFETEDKDTLLNYQQQGLTDFGKSLVYSEKNNTIYFGMTEHGFNNIYKIDCETREVQPLTRGKQFVDEYFLCESSNRLVFTSVKSPDYCRLVYTINLETEKTEQVSYLDGEYSVWAAHKGDQMIQTFSDYTTPTALYHSLTLPKSKLVKITKNMSESINKINLREPAFSEPLLRSDYSLTADVWLPEKVASNTKLPLIVYLNDGLSPSESMNSWNPDLLMCQWLAELGFVTASVRYQSVQTFLANDSLSLENVCAFQINDIREMLHKLMTLEYVDPVRKAVWGNGFSGLLVNQLLQDSLSVFSAGAIVNFADWNGNIADNSTTLDDCLAIMENLVNDDAVKIFIGQVGCGSDNSQFFNPVTWGIQLMQNGMVPKMVLFPQSLRKSDVAVFNANLSWQLSEFFNSSLK